MADSAAITTADVATVATPAATPSPTPAPETTAAVSTPSPSAASPEAATTAPADADELTDASWGQIPPSRRPRILENARKRAVEEKQREWDTQYGWAKDINRDELTAFRREQAIAGSMSPADYVLNLWQRVQADPDQGPRLRSMAAKILGQRSGAEDAMPEPDIPTDQSNGQPVVYSAQRLQKLLEWQARRVKADTLKDLAPMRTEFDRVRAEREYNTLNQQSQSWAKSTLDTVSKWPGFQEHAPTIMERYAALGTTLPDGTWMPDPQDTRSEGEKLRDIYSDVVLPTLNTSARQQAVQDITRKAGASTVSPSSPSTGQPFDFKKASFKEGLEYELRRKGIVK